LLSIRLIIITIVLDIITISDILYNNWEVLQGVAGAMGDHYESRGKSTKKSYAWGL
jgi:hypothetical protein